MRKSALGLDERLYDYLLEVSLREPEVLARLREETARLPGAIMQIAPEQGQFMRLLVTLTGARRAIEVGVYTGYSALSVALTLPEGGHLIACDINEETTAIARRYWAEAGVAEKIDLRLAPAIETLETLIADGEAGAFDFAFVDADKTEYAAYYECLLVLLRQGGLMVVDNVLWSGAVADPARDDADTCALRAFNTRLKDDPRIDLSLLPIADGLTLARKR